MAMQAEQHNCYNKDILFVAVRSLVRRCSLVSSRIKPFDQNVLVYSLLRRLVDSGTFFCEASGFTATDHHAFSPSCFDGKSSTLYLPTPILLGRMGRWMRGRKLVWTGRIAFWTRLPSNP
eukprot:525574_1